MGDEASEEKDAGSPSDDLERAINADGVSFPRQKK